MNINKINPINGNHLIRLDDRRQHGSIILGSDRDISSVHSGICLRSDRYEGKRLDVSDGGLPITDDESLRMVREEAFVRIEGTIQRPYVHIVQEEVGLAGSIWTPEDFYSGWYTVLEVFENEDIHKGDRVLPIYGEPRLTMEDESEYVHINAIGVVEVSDD
jgi:hypothetical protein